MGIFMAFCLTTPLAAGQKININTATKAQLISLKYVGEKLADRIIAHRKETPFKTPEDIRHTTQGDRNRSQRRRCHSDGGSGPQIFLYDAKGCVCGTSIVPAKKTCCLSHGQGKILMGKY